MKHAVHHLFNDLPTPFMSLTLQKHPQIKEHLETD